MDERVLRVEPVGHLVRSGEAGETQRGGVGDAPREELGARPAAQGLPQRVDDRERIVAQQRRDEICGLGPGPTRALAHELRK